MVAERNLLNVTLPVNMPNELSASFGKYVAGASLSTRKWVVSQFLWSGINYDNEEEVKREREKERKRESRDGSTTSLSGISLPQSQTTRRKPVSWGNGFRYGMLSTDDQTWFYRTCQETT